MHDFKQNLAVLIGINRYSHGISPLNTATHDATAIANILEAKHGYQVKLYLDESATLEKITALLQGFKLSKS